jgi:DNA replication initiation complex subunit (GINS family)
MNFEDMIRSLLDGAGSSEEAQDLARKSARCAWARETSAKAQEAQRQMDEICTAAVEQLDEAEFEALVEAEQAKVDAFLGPLRAAADEDKWPKELYFGGI